jgi:Septum formation
VVTSGGVRERRRFRTVAIAGLLTLSVLGTAGCSVFIKYLTPPDGTPATPSPHANSAKLDPKAGDCWSVSFGQLQEDATWESEARVDCTKKHQSYTYAVTKLDNSFTGSWQVSSTDHALRDDVAAAAVAACDATDNEFVGNLDWKQQLIGHYFFVAPLAKWNAGDRDVRCDVAILAVGSLVARPTLVNLPPDFADVANAVRSAPEKFDYCINEPGPDGDTGPLLTKGATIADCTKSPQWVLSDRGTLPGDASAPFPSDPELTQLLKDICKISTLPKDESWYAYFPQADGWANGERSVFCWVSPVATAA